VAAEAMKKNSSARDEDETHLLEKHNDRLPVLPHPNRMCIIITFVTFLSAVALFFFIFGWATQRWLLGVLFIVSIIPSFAILFFAYRSKDSRGNRVCSVNRQFEDDKVPVEILMIAFSCGVFITILVALIGLGTNALLHVVIPRNLTLAELLVFLWFDTFVLTAMIEEAGKFFVGYFSTVKPLSFYVRHPYGVVLYTLAGALGFAALENCTYILNEGGDGVWFLAVARAFLSVPLHALCGAFIGVGLARRAFFKEPFGMYFLRIFVIPVFIHGLYDFVFILPFRNGPYNRHQVANHLFTEDNTVNVGDFIICLYIFNILLVAGTAIWAYFDVGKLVSDYNKNLERRRDEEKASSSDEIIAASSKV